MLKKLTPLFAIAALLLVSVTACKKDGKSAQELVMGKWNLHSTEWHEKDGSYEDSDTEDMTASGSYLDFRNDGKVYMYMDGGYDTVAYTVKDNQNITLDGENLTLSKLN